MYITKAQELRKDFKAVEVSEILNNLGDLYNKTTISKYISVQYNIAFNELKTVLTPIKNKNFGDLPVTYQIKLIVLIMVMDLGDNGIPLPKNNKNDVWCHLMTFLVVNTVRDKITKDEYEFVSGLINPDDEKMIFCGVCVNDKQ